MRRGQDWTISCKRDRGWGVTFLPKTRKNNDRKQCFYYHYTMSKEIENYLPCALILFEAPCQLWALKSILSPPHTPYGAAGCTDSPLTLHTLQEIHLWDGSLSVMPLIWVWWRTLEPSASKGDFQPSLKGFLKAQMCHALNLIQLCLYPQGLLKGCFVRIYIETFIYNRNVCNDPRVSA